MVDAFFVATEPAPVGFVLKNRMEKDVDGESFPGARIASDQPASAKIVSLPIESPDRRCRFARF